MTESLLTSTLTLGGGCFWCLEALFKRLPGVISVQPGYAGGKSTTTTYQEVCSGTSHHAEVIQITYDPKTITIEALLDYFWKFHEPTTLNRQGPDTGTQYRSIILYQNAAEQATAIDSKNAAQRHLSATIVTEIVPLIQFIPAEAYHHDYYDRNPQAPYCQSVIAPKINKAFH